VYQDGGLCLFDPQAHTRDGASGHWDKGSDIIDAYRRDHKCNSICRSLGLHKETDIYSDTTSIADLGSRAHPLRVGFE